MRSWKALASTQFQPRRSQTHNRSPRCCNGRNDRFHAPLLMPDCPRCHQPVEAQAIACPYCRTPLKAHGHPGMPLHQATGDEPLCLSCTYHADDTCTFPKRPNAFDCTLYDNVNQPRTITPGYPSSFRLKVWLKRHIGWIALVGLLLLSLTLALLR